jgi:hypothetical protein
MVAKEGEKMAKILQFPTPKRVPPKRDGMTEGAVRSAGKDGCLLLLGTLASVPRDLTEALKMPERLFVLRDSPISLSSDPTKGIAKLAGELLMGNQVSAEALKDLPDYGIHSASRSSSEFFLLVDKTRGIIVWDCLGSSFGGDLSWDDLIHSVKTALTRVKELKGDGERFDLLLCDEGRMRMLKI